MAPRFKISQTFSVILVLLMGMALVMPPGLHLKFCLGDGGHLDISLDSCHDAPASQPITQGLPVLDQNHHGECLDITIACDSIEEFRSPARKVGVFKAKVNKDPPPAAVHFAGTFYSPFPFPEDRSSSWLISQTLLPSHLVSLRTLVLLI